MEHITIRSAVAEDAERILEIYSYYVEKTAVSFECEVPALEEFRNRIRKTLEKYPYLVLEKDGVIQGYSYAGPLKERAAYDRSCELTIYLSPEVQKCGFGKMLYHTLEEELRTRGMRNLYACIAYPEMEDEYLNRNSAEFHEHLGFVKNGHFHRCGYKFSRWYDMIWMEKIIGNIGECCKLERNSSFMT